MWSLKLRSDTFMQWEFADVIQGIFTKQSQVNVAFIHLHFESSCFECLYTSFSFVFISLFLFFSRFYWVSIFHNVAVLRIVTFPMSGNKYSEYQILQTHAFAFEAARVRRSRLRVFMENLSWNMKEMIFSQIFLFTGEKSKSR